MVTGSKPSTSMLCMEVEGGILLPFKAEVVLGFLVLIVQRYIDCIYWASGIENMRFGEFVVYNEYIKYRANIFKREEGWNGGMRQCL